MTWACLRQQQQQSKNLEKGLEPVTYESSIVSTMRHLCFVFLSANSHSDIEIVNSAIFTKGVVFGSFTIFLYTMLFFCIPKFFSSPQFNCPHQLCKKFTNETTFNIWRNEKYFLGLLIYLLFGKNLSKIQ